jgi:hypothetical protein
MLPPKALAKPSTPTNLEGLLDELAALGQTKEISVKQLLDAIGRRSFAPLLLLVSLLGFTPLGVVPGVPTLLAVFVILIAGQVAIGCRHVWLPAAMLRLPIEGRDLKKAAIKLKPFGRAVDKVIRPRLTALTERPFSSALAVACVMIALTVPPLELIPLVDIPLWGAMVAFSLALFAHDGVLAFIAIALTATGITLTLTALL